MKLTMLGTGFAMAQKCYNTCFVLQNGDDIFMVDAGGGNGILNQLEAAQVDIRKVHHLFVTHAHTDHLLGVIWVIRKVGALMHRGKYTGEFHIYCHDLVAQAITSICHMLLPQKFIKKLDNGIYIHEVGNGDQASMCGLQLTFFDIASTKAKQFGFRAVLPSGKVLVCLGDEPYNAVCAPYVVEPDWLLCEAFCLNADQDIFHPYEKHHSTALDAGRLAEQLGAKHVVLYHTEDKSLDTRKARYSAEAQLNFSGQVFVPDDLESIELE